MSEVKIPEGYKQTEVGVIPEDWDSIKVQDVCDFIVPGRNKPQKFDGDIPWITTPDLIDGRAVFFSRSGLKISKKVAKTVGSKIVPAGSVIMSCVGELGLVAIAGVNIVINQQLHAFLPSEKIDNYFLMYALKDQESYFYGAATKTALPYLNKDNCNATPLPLPSIQEQTTIATALSDVDNLIQSLEKLIAKKEAIKTGTMQQLLTGETRLPEFATREDGSLKGFEQTELGRIPEDWKVSTLGAISNFINGRAYSLHEWKTAGTPVIRLQNLTGRGENYYYSDLRLPEKQYCVNGDLLFMWSATFGPVIWRGPKAIFHYHIWKVICESGYSQSYLFYLLSDMTEKLKQSSSSGGTMLHITKQKMESINAAFPNEQEQTAIATILSDMDAEIQALEGRLEKTKDIKQGMMQQLLTGKVRLVDSSAKSDTQTLASKGELQA
ncbi:restriction endonuclease subunit S [Psychrobacter glacincola]|uniref:restriction endonuclease subunit S n=1 Tax=Psychrobacter glacincola TaxID=56810 RepID=UPI0039AFAD21